MSEVSGIELEKDAAGNNSYVRIDLKKYGDMINPILKRLGVNYRIVTLMNLNEIGTKD